MFEGGSLQNGGVVGTAYCLCVFFVASEVEPALQAALSNSQIDLLVVVCVLFLGQICMFRSRLLFLSPQVRSAGW
jgi:hypothetical protein